MLVIYCEQKSALKHFSLRQHLFVTQFLKSGIWEQLNQVVVARGLL